MSSWFLLVLVGHSEYRRHESRRILGQLRDRHHIAIVILPLCRPFGLDAGAVVPIALFFQVRVRFGYAIRSLATRSAVVAVGQSRCFESWNARHHDSGAFRHDHDRSHGGSAHTSCK